jgi:hypothetical protein
MKTLMTVVVLLSIAVTAAAQSEGALVLFPLGIPDETAGAFGTRWRTETWVHNGSDVKVRSHLTCGGTDTCEAAHLPGVTELEFPADLRSPINSSVILVPAEAVAKLTYSCRLFELSRHTQPVGVEIPVVKESELFTGSVRFVGINGSPSSRVALRLYDPAFQREGSVLRVDMLGTDDHQIATTTYTLTRANVTFSRNSYPSYAYVFDLAAAIPELRGVERYDVRVTPVTPGIGYYALMSVTDIDTQQVLLITTKQ